MLEFYYLMTRIFIIDNGVVAQSPILLSSVHSKKIITKIRLTYKGHWNRTGNALITNNGITGNNRKIDIQYTLRKSFE